MGSVRAGVLLGAALLLVVTGCASKEQGTAVAGGTTVSNGKPPASRTTSATATTSRTPVTRPRNITVSTMDPCRLMRQLPPEFEIQTKEPSLKDSLVFKGSKECIFLNPPKSYTLSLTTAAFDAREFADGGRGTVTPVTVSGFPAFNLVISEDNGACFLGVDVADGQMLYMQWMYSKSAPKPPSAELCANVTRVGAGILKVLGVP